MKKKLLDILACPMCKNHPLELLEIKSKDEDVQEGAMKGFALKFSDTNTE